MNLQSDKISHYCQALKLFAMAQEWSGVAQASAKNEHSFADFLEQ